MKVTTIFMVIAIMVCTMIQNSKQLYWNSPNGYSSQTAGRNDLEFEPLRNEPFNPPSFDRLPFIRGIDVNQWLPRPLNRIIDGRLPPPLNGRIDGRLPPPLNGRIDGRRPPPPPPPKGPHCDCSHHPGDTTGRPTGTPTIETSTSSGESEITYSTVAATSSEPQTTYTTVAATSSEPQTTTATGN
ncbi:hypothetical protein PUN28_011377 [Cardiocondyla obscurior]|uniref:Uncharacterized protein n=1 Tax=Cardiocondyla obscurior TaxID=286306 RepID=A0AAW2FEU7_9HYME